MIDQHETVVIAMSGGVDSSVAAALLVEQGFRVVGMMLRLWSEPGTENENQCCTPDSMNQARRVAAILGIPFYAIDARERFRATIVESFLDGYRRGETPNPCILCNRLIRWGFLMDHAKAIGASYLATGHYARIQRAIDGTTRLLKGLDDNKDQSYVLSTLSQEQLRRTLLPLGEFRKTEIREMARRLRLPVAERPDSQDLCFLAGEDYRQFLARYAPEVSRPGAIVTRKGEDIGQHAGLAFYTVGQRKGLGIAGPEPLYVLEKDVLQNRLVVGTASELGGQTLKAGEVNWVSGIPQMEPFRAEIKIRYKAKLTGGIVIPLDRQTLKIQFDFPLRDITPGQFVVMYNGDVVVASARILDVNP